VLEAFAIDKHRIGIFNNDSVSFFKKYLYFFYDIWIEKVRPFYHSKIQFKNILFYYFKLFYKYIQSFFFPTNYSTKNYTYGRITQLVVKTYFRLLAKNKLLIFYKYNLQVIKMKIQFKFQQIIKDNFGLHYPYSNRLFMYYPYFVVIFFLILFHNFNGLLFYGFTNTAFLLQNCVISFQSVIGLTILGIYIRSYNFYKMFVPGNVPVMLKPFLVIIEVISHIAKMFSLAIRLFANMMSGHVLLHILTGFIIKLGIKNLVFAIFPLIIIMFVICLEFGITFLQAYVFVTLLSIYFEEHFGFDQDEKIKISKMITINGQKISLVKNIFLFVFFLKLKKHVRHVYVCKRDRFRSSQAKHNIAIIWMNTIKILIALRVNKNNLNKC
jgi:F-type H+-transporting ATPase subunit a